MNQTFEVRQSRPKVLWGIVVCIVFVAIGLWLTTQPDTKSHLIGWGTVVFFGSLAPTWVATLFNPGRLIADSRGLTVISPFSERRWDWVDVEAVQVWKYRGSRFVQLKLKEAKRIEGWGGAFWPVPSATRRLPTAWAGSPEDIVARLEALKARDGRGAPSRTGSPIVI